MHARIYFAALAAIVPLPGLATSQQANPVADAFRDNAKSSATNLIAAAEEFPADKYGYKPTPAQMSVGDIVVHLSQGNDYLCGAIGGMKAPERTKLAGTDSKDALIARLRETTRGAAALFRRPQNVARGSDDANDGRLGRPLQPVLELSAAQRDAAANSQEACDVGVVSRAAPCAAARRTNW